MKEAGYKWDAEKKELKKIEQKPTYSEEYEKILKEIKDNIQSRLEYSPIEQLADMYSKEISWLKSFKDRVQPKQEWSEDDSWMLNVCCNAIDSYKEPVDKYLVKKWLKSLKPNHWKPSEEQMKSLKCFIDFHRSQSNASTEGWKEFKYLESLYNDLKTLNYGKI